MRYQGKPVGYDSGDYQDTTNLRGAREEVEGSVIERGEKQKGTKSDSLSVS